MTEDVIKVKKPVSQWKLRFMGAIAAGSGLVAVVRAATPINDSVGPLLDSIPALFTSLVALVIAAIPINLHRSVLAVGDHDCAGNCRIYPRTFFGDIIKN